MIKFLSGAAAAVLLAGSAQAAVIVSVEAAGVQSTTVAFPTAVETFDAQSNGTVVPVNTSFAALGVTGTFSSTQILVADQYGGAGGTGNQVAVRETGDLTIDFSADLGYFGVWASALDANNTVSFYKDGDLIDSVNLTAYSLDGAYFGNPTTAFLGQNAGEKYAFFNFAVDGGYDQVVLSQNGGGGFELDNVTIGDVSAVPEPAMWAMMIGGFALTGLRARRRQVVAA